LVMIPDPSKKLRNWLGLPMSFSLSDDILAKGSQMEETGIDVAGSEQTILVGLVIDPLEVRFLNDDAFKGVFPLVNRVRGCDLSFRLELNLRGCDLPIH
jgi:hypothetical protein